MMKDANSGDDGGFGLTEEEKKQLILNAEAIDKSIETLNSEEGDD
jgi:hypothetical protein